MDSTNKSKVSQITGDLIVSSSLLSMNRIAYWLNKGSKAKWQQLPFSKCHKSCWINEEVINHAVKITY